MFRRGKFGFLSAKDDRIKVFNERVTMTERHLIEICCNFATCTTKLAKYRDSYDELAKSFKNYSHDEEINETLNEGMNNYANAITILSDYMDLQVQRMEAKIVNELAQFENLCKSTRDNLRSAVIARDKEVLKHRQMQEIKSKFNGNNTPADSDLLKVKQEIIRSNKEIDDVINNFEERKLSDIKTILTDFILISIKYHTKAIEALSTSYSDVSNIDEHCDLMEFVKLMKTKDDLKEKKPKYAAIKRRSQSMENGLERNHLSNPIKNRHKRLSRSSRNLADQSDDEDDDDDDDEDDDDENDKDEVEDREDDDENDDDEEEADDNDDDEDEKTADSADTKDDTDSASDDYIRKVSSKSDNKQNIKSKFQIKSTTNEITKPPNPQIFKSKLRRSKQSSDQVVVVKNNLKEESAKMLFSS